jgi:hypothetical protein
MKLYVEQAVDEACKVQLRYFAPRNLGDVVMSLEWCDANKLSYWIFFTLILAVGMFTGSFIYKAKILAPYIEAISCGAMTLTFLTIIFSIINIYKTRD